MEMDIFSEEMDSSNKADDFLYIHDIDTGANSLRLKHVLKLILVIPFKWYCHPKLS